MASVQAVDKENILRDGVQLRPRKGGLSGRATDLPLKKATNLNAIKGYGMSRAIAANNIHVLKDSSQFKHSDVPTKKLGPSKPTGLRAPTYVVNGSKPSLAAGTKRSQMVYRDVSPAEVEVKPKPQVKAIPDPDIDDDGDESMASAYVKDIMKYLHESESNYSIPENFLNGRKILPTYRKQLLNWIFDVHGKVKALPETLFLAVYLIDRFTHLDKTVKKEEYQLIGITAFWVAAKFEEIYPSNHHELVKLTDNAYRPIQMRLMEKRILRVLQFDVNRPLACVFLRRASKVLGADVTHHTMAKFLIEVALLDYNLVSVPQSKIAAAALCLTIKIFEADLEWGEMMEKYTFYSEGQLRPTMSAIASAYATFKKSPYQSVFKKYTNPKLYRIANHRALNSTIMNSFISQTESQK